MLLSRQVLPAVRGVHFPILDKLTDVFALVLRLYFLPANPSPRLFCFLPSLSPALRARLVAKDSQAVGDEPVDGLGSVGVDLDISPVARDGVDNVLADTTSDLGVIDGPLDAVAAARPVRIQYRDEVDPRS